MFFLESCAHAASGCAHAACVMNERIYVHTEDTTNLVLKSINRLLAYHFNVCQSQQRQGC